jgi:hypothetical protein
LRAAIRPCLPEFWGLAAGLLIVLRVTDGALPVRVGAVAAPRAAPYAVSAGDAEIVVLARPPRWARRCSFAGALLPPIGLLARARSSRCSTSAEEARHLPWTASSFAVGLLFGAMFQWTGDLTARSSRISW